LIKQIIINKTQYEHKQATSPLLPDLLCVVQANVAAMLAATFALVSKSSNITL